MRKAVEAVLAVLGCAIVALVVGFILSGLGASGVVSMQITHALFWLAFGISVVAAPLAAWLISPSWKSCMATFVCTAIVVGGGLWWLDSWLTIKKAEQDLANQPPVPLHTTAPSPSVPVIKSPRPSEVKYPKLAAKIAQHGSGSGAVGGSINTGPCSNVQIGGNGNQATTNCGPMEPVVTASHQIQGPHRMDWLPGEKATGTHYIEAPWENVVRITTTASVSPLHFRLKCSGPVKAVSAKISNGIMVTGDVWGRDATDNAIVIFEFQEPEALVPGQWIAIAVLSDSSVTIESGTVGKYAIQFAK